MARRLTMAVWVQWCLWLRGRCFASCAQLRPMAVTQGDD